MATQYQRNQGWTDRSRQDAPRITISVADVQLKNIPATLFSDIAQDKARTVHEAGEGKKNKSTQLRRFYDELVMWYERVQFERDDLHRETVRVLSSMPEMSPPEQKAPPAPVRITA